METSRKEIITKKIRVEVLDTRQKIKTTPPVFSDTPNQALTKSSQARKVRFIPYRNQQVTSTKKLTA